MSEETNEGQLTVDDILAEANNASYHSILELWSEVLRGADEERDKPITPQWANRIVTSYQGVTFQDMPAFRDLYFESIEVLRGILTAEIDDDDEALKVPSAVEDVEQNSAHYLNVLINWQKQFLQWELEWDTSHRNAGVHLAVMSEVHKMFFDQVGLTSLLDQINYEFTDADRDFLQEQLQEMVNSAGGTDE